MLIPLQCVHGKVMYDLLDFTELCKYHLIAMHHLVCVSDAPQLSVDYTALLVVNVRVS